MTITGKDLISWGYQPGKWFKAAIDAANASDEDPRAVVARFVPPAHVALRDTQPYHLNIHAENEAEADNIAGVERHMKELMRVPTIVAGAVMPDACPSGQKPGTI